MTRLITVVTALFVALMMSAGPAAAHSAVIGSSPDDGERIAQAPDRVSLTFNEALQPQFAALTVVGPDGNLWSVGDPVVEGPTISVGLDGLGPVGEYTVAYRVTSADGHPVSGTRVFTLTEEGTGTPGAPAAGSGDAAADDAGNDGPAVWWFVVAGVVVVAAALWFALRKPKA
ncbi:MAG: copper resistance protein CopC [Rhodococcus sp.]|uniref:copper resistance CopC family protein n=1 Tax=Rhodococcus TaxID=1827 RepID=UPI0016B31B75|nr:copper resistance CopC family protein [Rhodococcus sp. (in: high G+C Gram-positive bacteria)]NLV80256.1 copper resistance protein CopC [Rhodococcus sp. (in: high G+C Gram-positive bacteria)]